MRHRLDQELVKRGLVSTRSQAETYIKLGQVEVDKRTETKPSRMVSRDDIIELVAKERYVSRAGLKLASVADKLKVRFKDQIVLDVGSSTGGFTDYALKHGARKVIAVDVGTEQMHPSLRSDPHVELYEKTDIRNVSLSRTAASSKQQAVRIEAPDIILIDVSFISLRQILPHVSRLMTHDSILVAMAKPQFEARQSNYLHKGVIKNDKIRREILQGLEMWLKKHFVIKNKSDSSVLGEKGNLERFYLLQLAGN